MTAGEILGAVGKINPQFASIVSEKLANSWRQSSLKSNKIDIGNIAISY